MKLSLLNLKQAGLAIMTLGIFSLAACNNSNEDKNDVRTTTPPADTSTTVIPSTKTDTTGMTTAKKIGKVSITPVTVDKSGSMKTDDKGYYNYTETAPAFPGGHSALENYIMNNLEYPQDAIDNNIEGTVFVMFTIDENGKVGNAKTSGTAMGYGLEEEAVRVVNGMSAWTPGTTKGKKTKAWYTIPITYKLES